MQIKHFLKLVEIQTKVASVIPFAMGTLYALAVYGAEDFKPLAALTMLASLLCIDMATTALNNYMDFKRAKRKHGYGYEVHNAIVRFNMSEAKVVATIVALIGIGAALGLLLVLQTHWLILGLGALSFAVGIVYSFGPMPISRTALGEFFSGGFMGVLIPVIAVMIHLPMTAFFTLTIDNGWLTVQLRWLEILKLGLATMPLFAAIANIMLANNLCDQHEDLENHRYTLPITIGTGPALFLFEQLYYFGYICVLVLMSIGGLPWWFLGYGATLPLVMRQVKLFKQKQVKAETFVYAVKIFALQGAMYCGLMAAYAVVANLG